MKHLFSLFLIAVTTFSAFADLHGDGYYRVQNVKSLRYIYVLDNTGELNMEATTADLGALELWTGYEKTISDPATVIFVKDLDGKKRDYDFQSQGTGVGAIINHPVSVTKVPKTVENYLIFGRNSGLSRYIGDDTKYENDRGRLSSTEKASSEWAQWLFHPILTDNSQYFGLLPEFTDNSGSYTSIYADFPFSFESEGMKAFYVEDVIGNVAVIKELDGVVPRGTPVIVKCAGNNTADNKLKLGGTAEKVSGNKLQGVYFKNESRSHNNVTAYDKATMRVLGITAEGKLGFVTDNTIDYLPRNRAYITVEKGAPAELKLMTHEEYYASAPSIDINSNVTLRVENGVLRIAGYEGKSVRVCNICGATVYDGEGTEIALPGKGIYIVSLEAKAYKIIVR